MKTLLQKLKNRILYCQKSLVYRINSISKSPVKLIFLVIGVSVLLLLGFYLSGSIVISHGQSIDRKVFFKLDASEIKRGNYVLVQLNANDQFVRGRLISKKVGCLSGETLKIQNDEYFCGDEYLGKAKRASKTGIPVKPFNPCNQDIQWNTDVCEYKIPDGRYFLIGTHKDSYDSRYFGLVSKEEIKSRLLPLW